MSKEIKHSIFYQHPPQDVWEYLTKPQLIELWLMKNDFQPIVGRHFQFRTNPIPQLDFNGIINCKVLEVIPFKRLSYTWAGGDNDGNITLDSVVEWILTPKDNGTELQLVHSGFKEVNIAMFTAMDNGWYKNIHKITDLLNAQK
jgi:uncharacterized protein YndB with AHSA1/START domain